MDVLYACREDTQDHGQHLYINEVQFSVALCRLGWLSPGADQLSANSFLSGQLHSAEVVAPDSSRLLQNGTGRVGSGMRSAEGWVPLSAVAQLVANSAVNNELMSAHGYLRFRFSVQKVD